MSLRRVVVLLVLLVFVLPVSSTVAAQSYEEIPYVPNGDSYRVLEVYLPEIGAGPFPTILEFHPRGGVPGGSDYMRSHLLEQGYALVGVEYDDFDWRQGVEDSFCALAWLHTEGAEHNLDATRGVAFGFSLGGLMVSYLGTVDDPAMFLEGCPNTIDDPMPLRGVIDSGAGGVLFEVPDRVLSNFSGYSTMEVAVMRANIEDIPSNEWAESLSGDERAFAMRTVSFWIDGNEPPVLLIHGEIDGTIPAEESVHFAEVLEAVGSPVELLLLPDYGHMNLLGHPSNRLAVAVNEAVDAFLDEVFTLDDAQESS